MTIDDRNDIERDLSEIENALGRLSPSPAPPGLRQGVMDRAFEAQKNPALTPGMKILAAACSVVIVAVLAIDPLIGGHESARLAALRGVPEVTEPAGQGSDSVWAELGVDLGDIDRALRTGIGMSGSRDKNASRKDLLEARDWLKGMTEHEDPEGIF